MGAHLGQRVVQIAILVVGALAFSTTDGQVADGAPSTPGSSLPFVCGSLPSSWPKDGAPLRASTILGRVRAELVGWQVHGSEAVAPGLGDEGSTLFRAATLTIWVDRRSSLSARLFVPPQVPGLVQPSPEPVAVTSLSVFGDDPVCVARFGGKTAVLVGLFAEGSAGTWVDAYVVTRNSVLSPPVRQDMGNPHGASLADAYGGAVLVTADNSFAYRFAPLAGSGVPVRVLQLRGQRFINITRHFPKRLAFDATMWWQAFEEAVAKGSGGLGFLAPWVADECQLAETAHAWAEVHQLEREGRLTSQGGYPSGAKYVTKLRAFLAARGYCA